MPEDWIAIAVVVVVAGVAALWRLPARRRIVILLVCVPFGGYCSLQMDDRATGVVLLALPTLVLLGAALVFAPFNSKRVEALSALAAAAMLWVGFMGVLLAWSVAWRYW